MDNVVTQVQEHTFRLPAMGRLAKRARPSKGIRGHGRPGLTLLPPQAGIKLSAAPRRLRLARPFPAARTPAKG